MLGLAFLCSPGLKEVDLYLDVESQLDSILNIFTVFRIFQ